MSNETGGRGKVEEKPRQIRGVVKSIKEKEEKISKRISCI